MFYYTFLTEPFKFPLGAKENFVLGTQKTNLLQSAYKKKKPPLPRILCWIMTDPQLLDRATHVKETWASHCDLALFMSSEQNDTFPTIGMNVSSGRSHIDTKTRNAWNYVYKHHGNDFEYFVKCDADTFLIIENLKRYMAKRDPEKPEFFGHRMYLHVDGHLMTYNSGGPGQVLSRKALHIMVERAFTNKTFECMPDGEG